jgi:hypothetical protein
LTLSLPPINAGANARSIRTTFRFKKILKNIPDWEFGAFLRPVKMLRGSKITSRDLINRWKQTHELGSLESF